MAQEQTDSGRAQADGVDAGAQVGAVDAKSADGGQGGAAPKAKPAADEPAKKRVATRKARKSGSDYKDKRSAVKRRHEELVENIKAFNEEQPASSRIPIPPDPFAPPTVDGKPGLGPGPAYPAEVIAKGIHFGSEFLGERWEVESRPDPDWVEFTAEACSAASTWLEAVDPKTAAFATAAFGIVMCAWPMYSEKKAREKVVEAGGDWDEEREKRRRKAEARNVTKEGKHEVKEPDKKRGPGRPPKADKKGKKK